MQESPNFGQPKNDYTGVGRRLLATVIDFLIWGLGFGYLVALLTGNTNSGFGFNLTGGPALLLFLMAFLYYVVMEAVVGFTVGKFFLGMRVTKDDGGTPIGWKASLIRNLLRLVDGQAFYLVGAILIWNSPRRQRLGDRLASTVVVTKLS